MFGVASAQTVSKSPAASLACSLLTKEDAAAALGEAVSRGRTGPPFKAAHRAVSTSVQSL
jgi:hypothetical protein